MHEHGCCQSTVATKDDPALLKIESPRQVRRLADEILDRERDYPVVGLTAKAGASAPAMSASRVRDIIGGGIPLYFVTTHRLTLRLSELLPDGLGVWAGATRIWWPGAGRDNDPEEHLVIYDAHGDYGEETYKRLENEMRVTSQPSLSVEQRLVLAERGRASADKRRREVERRLAELRRGSEKRLHDLQDVGQRLQPDTPRVPGSRSHTSPDRELDVEQRLHVTIALEWASALSATDRTTHPLGRYVFGSRFAETIQSRQVVPVSRIAWVCAMIACGHAAAIGLDLHRMRTGSGPTMPWLTRSDGARGWRCALKMTSGGPRIHYWTLPDGTIEFASVNHHDDYSIPGS